MTYYEITQPALHFWLPTTKLQRKQAKTTTHPHPPSGGLGGVWSIFLLLVEFFFLIISWNSKKLILPSPSRSASSISFSILFSIDFATCRGNKFSLTHLFDYHVSHCMPNLPCLIYNPTTDDSWFNEVFWSWKIFINQENSLFVDC